jgi:HEPN domain-containing protein
VAYHCQQLAEKYLKASLIQSGLAVPLMRDPAKLNRLAQGPHPELKEIQVLCELLTPFGTATRYPGSAVAVGPEHMSSVLGWAESIRQSVRDAFGLKQSDPRTV